MAKDKRMKPTWRTSQRYVGQEQRFELDQLSSRNLITWEFDSNTIHAMAEGEAEWELSKENIQPLRQGRRIGALQQALSQQDGSSYTTVQQQKQAFECELRMYTGDDPLDVWDRYIKWTQQVYPQGGKESNLSVLLERAVIAFANEKRYHNDSRYISLWLKHAENITEPLEIYSYMHGHGIGVQLAALYIAWSEEFEKHGNFKKADSIYQQGISCGAQPADKLHQYHKEFQARVSRQVMTGMMESEQEEESSEPSQPQRSSLVDLKPRGKKTAFAPVVRTGASVSYQKRGLSLQLPAAAQSGHNSRVMVFDENQGATVENCEPKAEQWTAPPTGKAKENEIMPEKWTNVKMPQKFGSSAVPPSTKPTFQPFVEECDQPPAATPCKINPAVNTVLSARKPSKEESALERLQQQHIEEQPKEQSMYCKELLFRGATEFCFEELRAERYYKKVSQEVEEKTAKLKVVKEDLKRQVEAKQKLLHDHSFQPSACYQVISPVECHLVQQVMDCPSEAVGPLPVTPFSVYDESEGAASAGSNSTDPNEDLHLDKGVDHTVNGPAMKVMPFTIFCDSDTSEQSQEEVFIAATSKPPTCRSLNNVLKPEVGSVPRPENDTLERMKPMSEDSILGSYRNKTLCPSPEHTRDFVRAVHLASTPSNGSQGERASSDLDSHLSALPPFAAVSVQTPASKQEDYEIALCGVNQLSPIQEVSQENGQCSSSSSSLDGTSSVKTMLVTHQSEPDTPELTHIGTEQTARAFLSETVMENPSSADSRRRALEKLDLDAFPNFFRKAEPLPRVMEGEVLFEDGETIVVFSKIASGENYSVYLGKTNINENVVVKVDHETIPWDFYIHVQLRTRLDLDSHKYFGRRSSCFLYKDGCITLFWGHHCGTLQDFLARSTLPQVASLALELLEIVQKMHSCHLLHGDIRPGTLYLCYREACGVEDSILKVLDFSHSLDLDLQSVVISTVGLPETQTLLEQGILLSTSSPYQVDLLGVAETVYMMLKRKKMKLVKKDAEWMLDDLEISGTHHAVWQDFFKKILNADSPSSVLTELQELLKKNFNDCIDDQLTSVINMVTLDVCK